MRASTERAPESVAEAQFSVTIHIMDTANPANVLSYAAIDVRTHQRKTLIGTLLRWLGRLAGLLLLTIRLLFLAAGYVIIAIGQIARLFLGGLGAIMLLLGGLQWQEIKHRLMWGANWVDRVTLRMVHAVSRNPLVKSL